MKKAKLEKSPWVKVKKKPGPKKVEKFPLSIFRMGFLTKPIGIKKKPDTLC